MNFSGDCFKHACDLYDQKKYSQALSAFHELALNGSSGAQNNIGGMYESGLGVPPSNDKALYWYKKAFRNGSHASLYNVADLYRKMGKIGLAKKWFKRAVELGDGESSLELAKIYLSGRRTISTSAEVRSLLEFAINPDNSAPESVTEARELLASISK